MSRLYTPTVTSLTGSSTTIPKIMSGQLAIPDPSVEQPPGNYGFPPALIPLWSDGSGPTYTGIWWHPFSKRPSSFVRTSLEDDCRVREIARNERQLFTMLILELICSEDELTPEIAQLANTLGIDNINVIDQISQRTGDELPGLRQIKSFQEKEPLAWMEDPSQYTGSFPTTPSRTPTHGWHSISPFECDEATAAILAGREDSPAWFGRTAETLFEESLRSEKPHYAWMALNSPGWHFKDASKAMKTLANKVQTERFSQLTQAWLQTVPKFDCSY